MDIILVDGILRGNKRSVFKDHQLHRIHIGGNRCLTFQNYQDAQGMLATINRELTEIFTELSAISTELYAELHYRYMFLTSYQRDCHTQWMIAFNESALWIFSSRRQISYTWNRMVQMIEVLEQSATDLQAFDRYKGNTAGVIRMNVVISRLKTINERMNKFPDFSGPFTLGWY